MRVVAVVVVVASAITGVTAGGPIGSFHTDTSARRSVVVTPSGEFGARASGLLASIARVEPAALPSYIARHEKEISSTLVGAEASRQVSSWWSALATTQRHAVERSAPAFLGNLGGIPFEVRDSANLSQLRATLGSVTAKIQSAGRAASDALKSELEGLRSIESALRNPTGTPKRMLTTFDPTGPMRAAIAIGDVDRADDVSILVPGMFYSVAGQLADWAETAQTLYQTQRAWLKRLGNSDESVATIAWLGYRTPDLTSALSLTDAREGASLLADAIAGIRASRGTTQPYLSVLAHSYGSTAAFLALQEGTVKVDALAVVGSPGSVATSVHDLDVPADRVFVGAALLDPIAGSGYFGTNPGSHDYGAHPLGVVGGIDPVDGRLLLPAIGHNGYFAPGTESMRNLALVAIDDCTLITG